MHSCIDHFVSDAHFVQEADSLYETGECSFCGDSLCIQYAPNGEHDCPDGFDEQPMFDVTEWGLLEANSPDDCVLQGECGGCGQTIRQRYERKAVHDRRLFPSSAGVLNRE